MTDSILAAGGFALTLFAVRISTGGRFIPTLIISILYGWLWYDHPIFAILVTIMAGLLLFMWAGRGGNSAADTQGLSYFHYFFGDNRFSGFVQQERSSYRHLSPSSREVPMSLRQAAREATSVDPYATHPGAVIVKTEVAMERGRPVIYDHIVTGQQAVDRSTKGTWDTPQDYDGFPAPTGLAAQFMSQFNGPKTTKVRRK